VIPLGTTSGVSNLKLPAGLIQADLSKVCSGQSVAIQHWVNVCLTDKTNNHNIHIIGNKFRYALQFGIQKACKDKPNKVAERKKTA
jgi:hypothetical protein